MARFNATSTAKTIRLVKFAYVSIMPMERGGGFVGQLTKKKRKINIHKKMGPNFQLVMSL